MIGILWVVIGVVLLGCYNGLLLLDDKTSETDIINKKLEEKWHFVGATIFLYLTASSWLFFGIQYAPLTLSLFWSLFGGIVHYIGLKRPFFFVGTTAKTDILFRKVFPKRTEMWSGIIKSIISVGAIVFALIYK